MNNGIQIKEERARALYAGGASFYFFIIMVYFFWAISGPMTKISYAGFGVSGTDVFELMNFAGIRLFGAGAIGLAYCRIRGVRLMPEHFSDFRQIAKLGLIMGVAQYIFFNFGAAFSSGVQISILSSAGAFCGILISALIFKEDALTPRKLLGCVLGVIAVIILNWKDINMGVTASLFGAFLLLLGQISGSFGAAYLKIISRGRSAIWVGGWQSVISGALLMIIGLCGNGSLSLEAGSSAAFPMVVLILTSGAALIFSNQLYKYNPLSKVMIFSLLSPVLGVFSSAIMLGDSLYSGFVFASLIINCVGVALVTTEKSPAEHKVK
ncbi:MAG TPA: DMT family transporter [Bacillota bacterium]|nr:DMT family transporter [Bacillota bacterium]